MAPFLCTHPPVSYSRSDWLPWVQILNLPAINAKNPFFFWQVPPNSLAKLNTQVTISFFYSKRVRAHTVFRLVNLAWRSAWTFSRPNIAWRAFAFELEFIPLLKKTTVVARSFTLLPLHYDIYDQRPQIILWREDQAKPRMLRDCETGKTHCNCSGASSGAWAWVNPPKSCLAGSLLQAIRKDRKTPNIPFNFLYSSIGTIKSDNHILLVLQLVIPYG